MKKCVKCKQQIPNDCDVCTYCGQWQEQITIEIESDKIDNCKINIDELKKVNKKKRKKILIPVISVVIVIAILAVIFISGIPEKYFGDFFAEPSVVTEESDNKIGLRFNFDKMGLQQLYVSAREKLDFDNSYLWLEAWLETVGDDYQSYGVDSTYYSYENSSGDIKWWINIFEEHSSQKVSNFEICMRLSENERNELDKKC